ncbi:MAG: DUF4358 domain-containing protein [Acetatifactor sp.]|nr:DUF4358 domain-containing protein [Acetatifactor sp.]
MKKLAVLFLTAALVMSLPGCGNKNGENEGTGAGDSQESTVVDSSEESQPETDPVSDEDMQPEDEISQTPEEGISEEMSAIRQAVVDALGDNYWPDMQIPPEYLEGYGLTSDMYTDFWGEMPMISTNVDTIIVIKASEGQIDTVKEVLDSYRDALVGDTMQYPMNLGKIQASQIEVVGDYACFAQLGADTIDLEDEEAIRHCQEHNELALEAIKKVVQQ